MVGPEISIIVPTFNEEQNISRLLDIFAGQPDMEVIVSDGGSYDRTPQVCSRYPVKFIDGGHQSFLAAKDLVGRHQKNNCVRESA